MRIRYPGFGVRPTASLAGAAICGALLTAAVPAAAEPFNASYEVYFGGFHVLNANAQWEQNAGSYAITGSAETQGFIGWMNPWKGNTVSRGRVEADRHIPLRYKSWNTSDEAENDGQRVVELTYDEAGRLTGSRVEPAPDPAEYHPLPDNAGDGTLDPLSVVASVAQLLQAEGRCEGRFAVFDGRKRYDLTVSDAGARELEPTSYSIYAGPAHGCRLEYTLLGGHRIDRNKYAETARERIVWVARPSADAPLVPVRLEIETAYGTLMGHLTGFGSGPQTEAHLSN